MFLSRPKLQQIKSYAVYRDLLLGFISDLLLGFPRHSVDLRSSAVLSELDLHWPMSQQPRAMIKMFAGLCPVLYITEYYLTRTLREWSRQRELCQSQTSAWFRKEGGTSRRMAENHVSHGLQGQEAEWSWGVCLRHKYAMNLVWHSDKSLEIWARKTGSDFSLLQSELLSLVQCSLFFFTLSFCTSLLGQVSCLIQRR